MEYAYIMLVALVVLNVAILFVIALPRLTSLKTDKKLPALARHLVLEEQFLSAWNSIANEDTHRMTATDHLLRQKQKPQHDPIIVYLASKRTVGHPHKTRTENKELGIEQRLYRERIQNH